MTCTPKLLMLWFSVFFDGQNKTELYAAICCERHDDLRELFDVGSAANVIHQIDIR